MFKLTQFSAKDLISKRFLGENPFMSGNSNIRSFDNFSTVFAPQPSFFAVEGSLFPYTNKEVLIPG